MCSHKKVYECFQLQLTGHVLKLHSECHYLYKTDPNEFHAASVIQIWRKEGSDVTAVYLISIQGEK